ncbi:hypothetical protein ZZ1p0163 [Acinetobacter phage ZZ1]|jgi:hypothetical protein|uniref:Uncharacterized protein n=3 Tax=Caudoviricetes TaxID=2731619 RepID=A0A410T5J4_9CAUD|nr:hypothetical protein ZZ1p0163 [Acinetobacter phage ZZ1]AEJ90216.1 hypothetical protein ZZ1p0163 [Acinetobacter phage ZZ1]QAU04017.1 hypothetical protein Henu6_gp214 [Acinetobacter phage Henu6]
MSDILPINSLLPTIMEGANASFTFTPSLAATEKLISLKIIQNDFPSYINVSGPTFAGRFVGLFKLQPGALKYRKGLIYGETDSFDKLPPKGQAQLYSYTAPTVMKKDFHLKVELKYSTEGNTELNITKDYIQPIQGDWNTFREQFINYVRS